MQIKAFHSTHIKHIYDLTNNYLIIRDKIHMNRIQIFKMILELFEKNTFQELCVALNSFGMHSKIRRRIIVFFEIKRANECVLLSAASQTT